MTTKPTKMNTEIMNDLKKFLVQAFRWYLCLLFAVYATFTLDVPVASAQYGPDTCIQGYVWRGTTPNDHVCVTPMQRQQAQDDNRQAASRIQPGGGAYGPKTCRQGYVWRAATPNDLVCVTWQTRKQVIADNAAAASRVRGPLISETMTDRCSGDVFISRDFTDAFDPRFLNGIYLTRNSSGNTRWSGELPIAGRTPIRWWCNSTTGNWADPGTWRVTDGYVGTKCESDWDQGQLNNCKPTGSLSLGSSAAEGWTPERSRCSSDSTQYISARLGPDRLLEIRCYSY